MPDTAPAKMVQLILVSVPGSPIPENSRLKQLLKCALRSYGFRCVRVQDLPAEAGKLRMQPGAGR
jgi:hypothetical protein